MPAENTVQDPISLTTGPVAVRTLRAASKLPLFILIGDNAAAPNDPPAMRDADASKLHWTLHDNLPWPTYYGLLRKMLHGAASKGDVFHDHRTQALDEALLVVIEALDKEIGIYGESKSTETVSVFEEAKPGKITKAEIAETLGWDRVPGMDYNANALRPGEPATPLDIRD